MAEFGRPAILTSWAKSLLKSMNYTQRRGTTKAKVSVDELNRVKASFLEEVIDVVTLEEISIDLIFNWDQTGLNLVPVSWRQREVRFKVLQTKRQFTGVFCGTLLGKFMPPQLIYAGKTKRCLPTFKFPRDWLISHKEPLVK